MTSFSFYFLVRPSPGHETLSCLSRPHLTFHVRWWFPSPSPALPRSGILVCTSHHLFLPPTASTHRALFAVFDWHVAIRRGRGCVVTGHARAQKGETQQRVVSFEVEPKERNVVWKSRGCFAGHRARERVGPQGEGTASGRAEWSVSSRVRAGGVLRSSGEQRAPGARLWREDGIERRASATGARENGELEKKRARGARREKGRERGEKGGDKKARQRQKKRQGGREGALGGGGGGFRLGRNGGCPDGRTLKRHDSGGAFRISTREVPRR